MQEEQHGPGTKELSAYELDAHGLKVKVRILDTGSFVPVYEATVPGLGDATKVLLISLRQELLSMVPIDPTRIEDKEYVEELTQKYIEATDIIIDRYLPASSPDTKKVLIAYVVNFMLGLGDLETPLADDNLEEVAVNTSKEPVWVYHKKFGWCKTNINILEESMIYDDAEEIGRRIGRQISNLAPLMDAELPDGSRVNATLYPISQKGNTITIRRFGKNPWTMPAMVANGTLSSEIASLIWLAVENEVSILISGGTASGKTSFLNAMSIFIRANHRVISVEQDRELTLPNFLHWVPMLTRQPNPEGKGEITLYDLMINALRQRPDVMLVGEVRTKKDAETLFEAIHTGHAVYGTVHADNAQDTIVRMTNPPIEVPKLMLNAFGGVLALFRHRRLGIRRVLEFAEMLRSGDVNVVYRWDARNDSFAKIAEIARMKETIMLFGGYDQNELEQNLLDKQIVMDWMVKNQIVDVDNAGFVVASYYRDNEKIIKIAKEGQPYSKEQIEKV
jgi:flagellar protein FlaI